MKKTVLLAASLMSVLTACGGGEVIKETIERDQDRLSEIIDNAKASAGQRAVKRFEVTDEIYLGFERLDTAYGDPLPTEWVENVTTLNFGGSVELQQVAAALRNELKIPVLINDQFPNFQYIAGATVIENEEQNPNTVEDTPIIATYVDETRNTVASPIPGPFSISKTGTWKELLDHIAATFKTQWVYRSGVLSFEYYNTETFRIESVAGTIVHNSEVTNAGDSDVGADITSSTRQTTRSDLTINIWENLAQALSARLPQDSRIVPNQGLQSITVTAPAHKFAEIRNFIEIENERLNRQVALHLDVFSVSITDRDRQRIGLNLAFQDLRDRFGFGFSGLGTEIDSSGSGILSASIITPPAGSFLSQFEQSQIVAESLRSSGEVVTVYENDEILSNLIPTSFQFTNQQSYICRRELGALGNGEATRTGVDPCVASSGFRINLLANIHDNGRLTLQSSMSISELVDIVTQGNEDVSIGLPNLNIGDVFGQAQLSSGQMVILSGFEQRINRAQRTEGGNIVCTLFCGADDFEGEIRKLYFVFTPRVLKRSRPVL